MQQACLFCRIIGRETLPDFVHDDDLVVASRTFGAPLDCAKKAHPDVKRLAPQDNALVGHIFQVAKTLAMQSNIHQKGYRTVFNVNAGAGQSVYHIHLHLLGGRMFSWPPG